MIGRVLLPRFAIPLFPKMAPYVANAPMGEWIAGLLALAVVALAVIFLLPNRNNTTASNTTSGTASTMNSGSSATDPARTPSASTTGSGATSPTRHQLRPRPPPDKDKSPDLELIFYICIDRLAKDTRITVDK